MMITSAAVSVKPHLILWAHQEGPKNLAAVAGSPLHRIHRAYERPKNLMHDYPSVAENIRNLYTHIIDREGFAVAHNQRLPVEESLQSCARRKLHQICQRQPHVGNHMVPHIVRKFLAFAWENGIVAESKDGEVLQAQKLRGLMRMAKARCCNRDL